MRIYKVENEEWQRCEVDEAIICAKDEEEAKRIYKENIENLRGYTLKVTEVKLEKGILYAREFY